MTEYVTFWYHDDLPSMEHGEEVVRCRGCKYYDDYTGCCTRRDYVAPIASTPDGFCAWGERKTINKTGDIVTYDNRAAGGTLTAEQVRKAIFNGSSYASYDGAQYYANGIDMQAISDELNSRAERTCEVEVRESAWGGYTRHCGNCGADLDCDTRNKQNYCPHCGAKVVGE